MNVQNKKKNNYEYECSIFPAFFFGQRQAHKMTQAFRADATIFEPISRGAQQGDVDVDPGVRVNNG